MDSLFHNSRKDIFNGLLRKTKNIINLTKGTEIDLESNDLNMLTSRYLVKNIIQSNLERTSNMKQIRPPKKKTPGITQLTNTKRQRYVQGYNPVHAVQEDKPSYSSSPNPRNRRPAAGPGGEERQFDFERGLRQLPELSVGVRECTQRVRGNAVGVHEHADVRADTDPRVDVLDDDQRARLGGADQRQHGVLGNREEDQGVVPRGKPVPDVVLQLPGGADPAQRRPDGADRLHQERGGGRPDQE